MNSKESYTYVSPNQSKSNNLFVEEFLSGCDVFIKINGKEIKISNFECSLQEQLKPLYGYASHVFDDMAVGSRIILGSFTVPISNDRINDIDKLKFDRGYYDKYKQTTDDNKPNWISKHNCSHHYGTANNVYNYDYISKNKNIIKYDKNIYNIQLRLLELGYNININGFLDFKTQVAIMEYQAKNNLKINPDVDEEFMKTIKNEGFKYLNNNTTLRLSPNLNSKSISTLEQKTRVKIISAVNEFYYVYIIDNNIYGYIHKSSIQ